MAESVEMAKVAARDGITTIVATPHVRDFLYPSEAIQRSVDGLNERLRELGIAVKILAGADVNVLLDPLFLKDYTIRGTDYILLEFPHSHLPRNAKDILFKIALKGLKPIITHPERNPSVIKNPALALDLVDAEMLLQITADSLVGTFGPEIRECAIHLLKKGVVSFIASDAHSSSVRQPVLSEGLRVAEKVLGGRDARRLVEENPEAVIKGNVLYVA